MIDPKEQKMVDNNWKPLLPKIKCPMCNNDLKELRSLDSNGSYLLLAWVCDCKGFESLEDQLNGMK